MRRLLACAAVLVAALPAAASARDRLDVRPFALIPTPGFPAMAYASPGGHVFEGTYDNPAGDTVPSRVIEFDGEGTLLTSWTIRGQDLSKPHGVQVATQNGSGRLVLLDKAPARALLLDPRTSDQTTYATWPEGSTPNYAAWGPDGSLYVTDYTKPTIWRVPPGGGTPEPWLTDPKLDGGGQFGTTGIALSADRRTLVVGQQSEAGGALGDPSSGALLTVRIGDDGKPEPLKVLWRSRSLDGPDGFAVARSGDVYVALLLANQIARVGPDGVERERFGSGKSSIPFDAPSSARFLGTRLMVANQAYFTDDTTHQAILDVETGEPGLPELIPPGPVAATPKPVVKKKRKAKTKARKKHPRAKHKTRHA